MRDLKVPGPKYREPGVLGAGPGLMGHHFREKGGLGSQSAPNLAQIPQVHQENPLEHRRRIRTKGRAKVVAAVWGTECIQFLATPAIVN